MSCYGCLAKFSFFTKEHSCPNCRFSFCSKCLKQKTIISEEEKNVCRNCFKKLTSEAMSSSELDSPDLLLKRLETLENPAKPPITIIRHNNRLNNLKYGLSSEDKKILERLEKLKADHRASPSLPDESEIKRRLALLQDKSIDSISDKPQKLDVPKKSHQEEVDDLLKQYADEVGMDIDLETRGFKKLEDIEGRLKKLQMSDGATADSLKQKEEEEDEESITARIIKKAIAEGQLEKRLEETTEKDSDLEIEESETEELPWCIICNENAVIRCFGCDGGLYCDPCFKQGHEFFNMEDHKFVPFQKKNSLSD